MTSAEGWLFLLRWVHFLAGITWIGMLYYVNFVQTPFARHDHVGERLVRDLAGAAGRDQVGGAGRGRRHRDPRGRGARAGLASRTNTLFSIPMLFFMGSASHRQVFSNGTNDVLYWILFLVIALASEVNVLVGSGQARHEFLSTVSGIIHAGLGVTLLLYVVALVVNS